MTSASPIPALAKAVGQRGLVVGIDPGLSGALAFCWPDGWSVEDMPTLEIVRGKTRRHDLDGAGLNYLLNHNRPNHVFLEQAQAMPKQSAYATGIFFQVYGEIRGILIGNRIPFTIVHPKTWKQALGVPAGKDAARARASQLLPDAARWWPLKKHDGRAEAALIAFWGSRTPGARKPSA